ncbi:hypothetical protein LUZ60_006361 [Juncus effusus]|nr:hypothetical protein LUZ60_006361 [Juncus effusus]
MSSQSTGGDSPEKAAADPRVQAVAAAGGGAKYKTMSPARLPITREACLTIPPGFSPSSLLESPVLLTNMKVEPSPTTGTMRMAAFMGKIVHSQNLPSPKENSNSTNISNEDNNISTEFEFKPHPNSSTQSIASFNRNYQQSNNPASFFQMQTQNQTQIQNPTSNSNKTETQNKPPAVSSSTEIIPLTEAGPRETASDDPTNISGPVSAEDGYNWRKYGQKLVKGSDNPRSYYKCTHPSCEVKKQLERSSEGQITEVVYKGQHNHVKPVPNRRLGLGGAVLPVNGEDGFGGAGAGGNEDKAQNNPSPNQANQSPTDVASDDDADVAVVQGTPDADVADDEDPESKRRKMEAAVLDTSALGKPNREPRVVVQTVSEVDILDDGYRWRKYGQKVVKGNPNPRSYYKCTNIGCPVRKHVERASHDPKSVITTYEGKHNHDVPTGRTGSGSGSGSDPFGAGLTRPAHQNVGLRPCGNNNGNGNVSLDLGVGINPNNNNNHNNHGGNMMHYQMQQQRNVGSNEGFSFKTGVNHSCYNGTGNLVLGP